MKKAIYALHVFVVVCFLPCMPLGSESLSKYDNHIRCIEREKEALLVFKQGVENEHDHLHSWKETKDCYQWKGVGCDNRSGHTALTHLNLGHNHLNGPIANSFALLTALTNLDLSANQFIGELPKSIYNLSKLQIADFSSNNFTGNLEDLLSGHFALLQELSLNKNQLTGSIPDITLLSSLRELHVNSNQLNGYFLTVFKHHSVLQNLDLSTNHLRGSLPDFTGFSSLWSLNLYNNEISGSLPDFTGCTALQVLQLSKNQLTKWETRSTGLLSSLQELDLSMNSIRSTISEAHLFNLSKLWYIRTSSNSLTFEFSSEWLPPFQLWELSVASCKLGPKFPNWIRNQQHIDHLDISNGQISDNIPIWFGNLSSVMKLLNLSSNKIRGEFSFNFVHVEVIDLSSNYFNGPLPPISAACSKINLSQNKFSGTLVPFTTVEYFSLSFVDISHNQLFGELPDITKDFRLLAFLNLGYNNFSGRIPTSVGLLGSLQTLILRNNKLYGELPSSLRNCSNLGFVDFGFNKISGKIPSWIGKDLPQLYALILKSNRFNGSLPSGICHLLNLHFLDLSINRLSGTIPPCFGNLTAMTQKGTEVGEHHYLTNSSISSNRRDYYVDNVLARWKGQEFEYGRNFAYLKMIDLSTNELTGEIAIGMTRLLDLKGLNLSRNRFSGKIPLEIGQLKLLECLDLSTNEFSGEIPLSMSGLNFLAFLDLSNNNFSGKIPSGTQLQGFSISAYEENAGLCGKPLTSICPGDEPANRIQPSSSKYEVDGDDSEYERCLYISAVLGFSTTFWGIIGTLVLNHRWRHAYFQFLHNLKERFYVDMAVCIARLQMHI
ncbi:receptor-like protein EIX2 [Heracleum sosnowskyi]|uniref:Receptor-like protein EIX2 n=1 Tax=Heracleum sosnowskyi TaxID=360622 RepID=A0AAD8HC79_9APIA|nr:receptor-like protein EIX2 [Heracleum sosnowskyi]